MKYQVLNQQTKFLKRKYWIFDQNTKSKFFKNTRQIAFLDFRYF